MNNKVLVSDNIYWIGVSDRETPLFENQWPLPSGVAYNSYLVVDEKVAIIDTVKFSKTSEFVDKIKAVIGDRPADYLVINHMEPDHSSSIADILKEYPNIKVIGNKKTLPFIKGFYGVDPDFIEVAEGTEISLGQKTLKFFMTPMIHWPESMMTYEVSTKVLFSMDAFGSFGAHEGGIFDDEVDFEKKFEDDMRRYYSNIVAKYSPIVQKALAKMSEMEFSVIAPAHGPIWRKNPMKVVNLYKKWSSYESEKGAVIVYGSMYGNTARMAEYLARQLAENGIYEVKIHDASKSHPSFILSDIWKYKAVVIGSCAYNSKIFSPVDALLRKLTNLGIRGKLLSIFGNKCWSGGGVSGIEAFAEELGWERIGSSIEATYAPSDQEFEALDNLAKEIAEALNR